MSHAGSQACSRENFQSSCRKWKELVSDGGVGFERAHRFGLALWSLTRYLKLENHENTEDSIGRRGQDICNGLYALNHLWSLNHPSTGHGGRLHGQLDPNRLSLPTSAPLIGIGIFPAFQCGLQRRSTKLEILC